MDSTVISDDILNNSPADIISEQISYGMNDEDQLLRELSGSHLRLSASHVSK